MNRFTITFSYDERVDLAAALLVLASVSRGEGAAMDAVLSLSLAISGGPDTLTLSEIEWTTVAVATGMAVKFASAPGSVARLGLRIVDAIAPEGAEAGAEGPVVGKANFALLS